MKKTLIHLFQNKFTDHDFYNREYAQLEKNFNVQVVIQDLSKIFYPKINHIKTKNFKNSVRFNSLKQFIQSLKKYKKKKNVVIVNELGFDSFKSLIIHYYLKKLNFKMIIDSNVGVIDPVDYSKNLSFEIILIKFFNVLKNPYRLIYFLKKKFLNILFYFIKFDKILLLTADDSNINVPFNFNSKDIIKVHSRDYSNYLNCKKENNFKKDKPIIFLDGTFPYFQGDEPLYYKKKLEIDLERWFREHNKFFDKLESFFSTKVIIVSHPKAKGIQNPFFKKRFNDHRIDASLKLTSSSLLFLCGMYVSTAISFPISAYKPILFINSDQMKYINKKQIIFQKHVAKLIGANNIDINNFSKDDILESMKVNRKLYDNYKYRFLTSKKLSDKPNNIILGKLF